MKARAFALAQAVGCRMVAAPPMGITGEAGMSCHALAERYAAVIDRAAESGVTPVLEFWGMSKTLGCLGEALFVAAECGRAQACVLADVFHMYKSSGQFAGLNLLGPKTLGMFHLNDYPASPPRAEAKDSDRVYPGDGVAPLKEIAAALRRAGYAGAVSLELFNKSYWEQDALTVARTGLAKMRAALSR